MRLRRFATVLLTAVAASLISAAPDVLAQLDQLKNTTPEQRAQIQTDLMKAKLALTPEQTSAIAAINEKYAKQMEPIIKGTEGTYMKMHHMRQVSAAKEAELKAALSPEQFQKYLAEKKEMQEQFEEKLLH
jgi:hypothetical protein